MTTNTDITIYSRVCDPLTRLDKWKKNVLFSSVVVQEREGIYHHRWLENWDIYSFAFPDISIELKKDDLVVKDNCPVEMQTVKDLEGLEKIRITSVNYNTFGENPHIKAVGA